MLYKLVFFLIGVYRETSVVDPKHIKFGSGSRIMAQFGSESRVMLSILRENKIIFEKTIFFYKIFLYP